MKSGRKKVTVEARQARTIPYTSINAAAATDNAATSPTEITFSVTAPLLLLWFDVGEELFPLVPGDDGDDDDDDEVDDGDDDEDVGVSLTEAKRWTGDQPGEVDDAVAFGVKGT
jgi:hypothetical protein